MIGWIEFYKESAFHWIEDCVSTLLFFCYIWGGLLWFVWEGKVEGYVLGELNEFDGLVEGFDFDVKELWTLL